MKTIIVKFSNSEEKTIDHVEAIKTYDNNLVISVGRDRYIIPFNNVLYFQEF